MRFLSISCVSSCLVAISTLCFPESRSSSGPSSKPSFLRPCVAEAISLFSIRDIAPLPCFSVIPFYLTSTFGSRRRLPAALRQQLSSAQHHHLRSSEHPQLASFAGCKLRVMVWQSVVHGSVLATLACEGNARASREEIVRNAVHEVKTMKAGAFEASA